MRAKTDLAYWRARLFKERGSSHWYVEIAYRGVRHRLSLQTPNKEAGARKARSVYITVQANGWDAALAKYRPAMAKKRAGITIGDYIAAAESVAEVDPKTLQGYKIALRKIVADSFGFSDDRSKYDPHGGGHRAWAASVGRIKLAALTPAKIQMWKTSFLAKAKPDPVSQRSARVSVNSFLRRARGLFSAKILKYLAHLELPDPLPFSGVQFEPRQSLKYRSSVKAQELIIKAKAELAQTDAEAFKVFLLAVMVGLRRHEIDLLEWDSVLWDAGVIRIQVTEFFDAKTEDSLGDIAVDQSLLNLLRGYRARATGRFVIESDDKPQPEATWHHYRCQKIFEKLTAWLRKQGVKAAHPLHEMRKEFGSLINARHGIHAASRALRHADISITNLFYTDSRNRALPGLDHLLEEEDRVVPIQGEPLQIKRKHQVKRGRRRS
jgi:integrase